MCSARDPSPQQSASSDPSANRAGIIPRESHRPARFYTWGNRRGHFPPEMHATKFGVVAYSQENDRGSIRCFGRLAPDWLLASIGTAAVIMLDAGRRRARRRSRRAGNYSWGSFRCAASEASRFRAASASRSAPSRAMVRSAERRSFRLCFDDACLDDACFASVIFQRPFSYRFNGYTRGRFGRAIPNLPKRA